MDAGCRLAGGAATAIPFADNPSFEAWMPNYQEAFAAIKAELIGDLRGTPMSLDIDADIEDFVEELQGIFDRAE